MARQSIKVALLGAGSSARLHAQALNALPGVRLVAICDLNRAAAVELAGRYRAPVFDSLDKMLREAEPDAVHVLTPPHLRCSHALKALQAGAHVLVETPLGVSRAQAEVMVAAAAAANRLLAVNYSFLALPAYLRLKRALADGVPGRIDSADIRWRRSLAPIRSGPFGLWMLQSPQNLLLELGPHLFAFATDLFGPLRDIDLRLSNPMVLPGGMELPQNWQIRGRAERTEVTLHLSLVEGAEDRSVELHGVAGTARLDYGADTLVLARPNASGIPVNRLRHEVSLAGQHLVEGLRNALRQTGSFNRKSPAGLGCRGTFGAFYGAIAAGTAVDARFAGSAAVEVMAAVERTLALLPAARPANKTTALPTVSNEWPMTTLVVGGTGFIGRALTRTLVAAGQHVRVLSRGTANPFADLGGAVKIVPGSLTDPIELRMAMQGVDTVYHLAKAEGSSWQDYLQNDVAVTEAIATAALAASVRRLVYTGAVAAYDASQADQPIVEATPFGPMEHRNLHARCKAMSEERLMARYRDDGLPLVIARLGIVVGPGGPLQHCGIGRWHGAGAVRLWGGGRNILPLVLIDDVAEALRRVALVPGVEGQSFNLIGEPLMSARDYFAAIQQLTGTRIRVTTGHPRLLYLAETVTYLLRRFALRQPGLTNPRLSDRQSRAFLSPFHNDRAKAVLNWQPEPDATRFANRAVAHAGFFGF